MNKKWLGGSAVLLLAGCASVEMAQYTVTSFAEIPLKDKANVKIVTNSDGLTGVVDSLKTEFQNSGSFKVVDDKADYWFVLNGATEYGTSDPQKKISVVRQEDANGGQEVFAETALNLSSAAKGVSVAVYETKTLAPVYYFEIPIYSGDNTDKPVREAGVYEESFSREVVERVKDAFITQQKQVETPIPLEADGDLRELFIKGGEGFAKGDKKAYEPFTKKYEQLCKIDIAKLCEQLRTNTYEGSDADEKLGNYYLNLLVRETLTHDPETLKKIKDEQLMVLRASDAKGLAEAVPVALARLEYKLSNLGE